MKIDFEVNDRTLGKNLHEAFLIINTDYPNDKKVTWGNEAFVIAQAEIAEFCIFPEYDEETEGTFIRSVVGKINGQVYAAVAVFEGGGVDVGHPLLIEHL